MAFAKSSSFKYGVIFLCLILGTWCGFYLQRFSAAASIFANVVDFTIDINELILVSTIFLRSIILPSTIVTSNLVLKFSSVSSSVAFNIVLALLEISS